MDGLESGSTSEDEHTFNLLNETSPKQTGNIPVSTQVSIQLEEKGQPQKMKQNNIKIKGKQITPPTIGVMFIDQTPGGVLAKKLQEVEDRLATASGYRIRMVELSRTQLQRLLPNTNPWSGHNCCYTCDQGGEVLQDCKRRNILYKSSCVTCNAEVEKRQKKESAKDLNEKKGVYVGESARSIFERAGEHQNTAI